jgi:hypothetical protein
MTNLINRIYDFAQGAITEQVGTSGNRQDVYGDAVDAQSASIGDIESPNINETVYVSTTDDLGQAITDNGSNVEYVLERGTHRAETPPRLVDDIAIRIPAGAVLECFDDIGITFIEHDLGAQRERIEITGKGIIDGRSSAQNEGVENHHVLDISETKDTLVRGITIVDAVEGDDMYVRNCEDVLIDNVTLQNAHRNNLSIIDGKNITVRDSDFVAASGTSPEDGLDIEPNDPDERLDNIRVINCRSENNNGNGFKLHTSALGADAPVDVIFRDCTSIGNASSGYGTNNATSGETRTAKIVSCVAVDNGFAGMSLGEGKRVELVDSVAIDNGGSGGSAETRNNISVSGSPTNVSIRNTWSISTASDSANASSNRPFYSTASSGSFEIIDCRSLGTFADTQQWKTFGADTERVQGLWAEGADPPIADPDHLTLLGADVPTVSQSGQPSVPANQLKLWQDTDAGTGDPTHYLIATDENGNTVTFASEETA